MSDTVKLIIEIPKPMYESVQNGTYCGNLYEELKNGTPLDENKGEWILKQRGKFVDIACSKCGYVRIKDYAYNYTVEELKKEVDEDITKTNFCECCGADMRPEPYKAESEDI